MPNFHICSICYCCNNYCYSYSNASASLAFFTDINCLFQTFHVVGLKLDRPCFLSKSTIAFILFNVFMYIVFLVQFITTEVTDEHTKVSAIVLIISQQLLFHTLFYSLYVFIFMLYC